MDSVPDQGSRAVDYPFRNTYTRRVQPENSVVGNPALRFPESDNPMLDETIEIVKDKVWSFRSALKAAAEALVSFGLPPQVVGYESVPLGEDDQLAQKNEAEAALQKVADDEMNSRYLSSSSSKSKGIGRGEESMLVQRPDDEDDTNHAFAEAVRKEKEERKSLTRTYELDGHEDEDGKGN